MSALKKPGSGVLCCHGRSQNTVFALKNPGRVDRVLSQVIFRRWANDRCAFLTEGGAYDHSSEPRTGGRYDDPQSGNRLNPS